MSEGQSVRLLLKASVTPLASILGSGLLIIVPVLERVLGAWSVVGAVAVCVVAWLVGIAIRHNVAVVEPLTAAGDLDRLTRQLGRVADGVIVLAYVISVALYLRIMAQYVIGVVTSDPHPLVERAIACGAVALIVGIGIVHGFGGLDRLDRISVVAVLVLTTVLGVSLAVHDVGLLSQDALALPPVPMKGVSATLAVLGGIVITVQGFETVRYLDHEFDAPTRIRSSRLAQLVAASIYIGFVAVATPVMGIGTPAGPDDTLLSITNRVAPLLAFPLALSAVLSQFSAGIADTAAADGNLRKLSPAMHGSRPYLLSGIAAIALAATVPTYTIVAVASRAFAAYYALQAVIALRTSERRATRVSYGLLALLMLAITVFAAPAG